MATLPDQTMWLFGSTGTLTSIKDRNGNQSSLTYDASGNLTSIGDPAGRGSLTLAYDTCHSGRLCSVTDWQTRTVSYGYDGNGRLQTVTNRTGNQTSFAYDGTTTSRLTTITDANSNVQVTNHYDTTGRVDWQKDSLGLQTGQQTSMAYDVTAACTSPTPPNPTVCTNTVSYPTTSFDNSNPSVADTFAGAQLSQRVTRPSSGEPPLTEYFGYNANGFRNLVTDARGNTTSFCYDVDYTGAAIPASRGNLTRRIEPTVNGSHPVTLFKFDTTQDVLQTYSPKGVASSPTTGCSDNLSAGLNIVFATDSSYDSSGNLKTATQRFTDPDSGTQTATTQYQYSDTHNPGRVTAVISPRNNTSSFVYFQPGDSQAGLLRSASDPLGNTTTNGYDAVGRKTSVVDANGNASGAKPRRPHVHIYV